MFRAGTSCWPLPISLREVDIVGFRQAPSSANVVDPARDLTDRFPVPASSGAGQTIAAARPVLVAQCEGSGRDVSMAAGRSPPSSKPPSVCHQPAKRAALQ